MNPSKVIGCCSTGEVFTLFKWLEMMKTRFDNYWFLILSAVLVIAGCNGRTVKTTVASFSDGSPKHVCYYHIKGNDSSLVKESYYYQNKNLRLQGQYVNDSVPDGDWTGWYDNGQMMFTGHFIDGIRVGNWKIWGFNGKECPDSLFEVKTDTVGLPSVIQILDTLEHNVVLAGLIDFYPNHCIKSAGPVKGNKKYGRWTVWYDDGTLWSEGEFKYDVSDGLRTVYYPDGRKYYEGRYLLGEKMGQWTFWNERGDVISQTTYKH
jgi:antitoxin component YwqK of YwqJK toxin-antitoxin module